MPSRPNRLRPYLRRAGMTQIELARAVRVTPEWISRIGRGDAVFSEVIERRIIRALNLTNVEAADAFGFPSLGNGLNQKGEGKRGSHLRLIRPGDQYEECTR